MRALSERVSDVPADRRVGDVVADLTTIERNLNGFFSPDGGGPAVRRTEQPLPDGVACFNGMYLRVTEAVRDAMPATFESPAFVERLDVLFAAFYLEAYQASEVPAWISKAWAPLFDRRAEPLLPLQFAITGMNAHINNDLAHALVLTWREMGVKPDHDTPERRDYEKVNGILEAVEAEIKVPLSDDVIAHVDKFMGHDDDHIALWSIKQARDLAWERAQIMRDVPGDELDGVFDRIVGFAGNLLLGP